MIVSARSTTQWQTAERTFEKYLALTLTSQLDKPHSGGSLRPSFFFGDSFLVLGEGGNYLFESSRNVCLKVAQSRALGSIAVGLFTYKDWIKEFIKRK